MPSRSPHHPEIDDETGRYIGVPIGNYDYEDEYSSIMTFDYGKDTSDIHYFDSWNDELRTVTYVTEKNAGHHSVLTETFIVPGDWEILTSEYYYFSDGYTAYLDAEHTAEYKYPGDGIDYSVYLSASNDND